ncbi:MAG: hypothetical protein Q4D53_05045 [Leptotrichiaceae bacterium]|nr:hypothetical protein [Leptotrichiaceae bacterium]
MKKLIILIVLVIIAVSCTAENVALWNEVDREMKEREHKCVKSYNGNIYCGYTK